MLNVALARHLHQDLHQLLRVKHLSRRDKLIANGLALEFMEAEFSPLDVANLFGGKGRTQQ